VLQPNPRSKGRTIAKRERRAKRQSGGGKIARATQQRKDLRARELAGVSSHFLDPEEKIGLPLKNPKSANRPLKEVRTHEDAGGRDDVRCGSTRELA